ncbi:MULTISPECIES: lipopolysaccharide biosynthesis protein [Gordonibacter]|uniref:lipopolysaccharide biosynthesis protein n=1 Tax=Gordonibacter TaxID=644652 RepID=UPI001D097CE2|nr:MULTISPECIES: lipopolysaccharide biosynthesis protein [Gordonibacter]MCB6312903.1 lipopolysaccharide biosynthesis protein [Gordonibacter pamelaeae]MCB7085719.1 lipopolysaccharide biosynthesis protein [Gordonibacter urolithinfaciens]
MVDEVVEPLSIRKNFLWNTAGCLVYQGCQWAITVIVVILSANYENSGMLAFAMSVGNVFSTIATYNVRTYQVSDVLNRFTSSNYVAFRCLTLIVAFVLVGFYLGAIVSQALIPTVFCYLLFKADESFCNVLYGMDQKAQRMDYIGVSQAARGALTLMSFSVILFLTQDLNLAILGMSALCIAVTFLYDRKRAEKLGQIIPSISLAKAKELFVTCFPAVVTLCCFGLVVMIARQVFENMRGAEALGIYAAVATPTVIVQVASSYLYAPFISKIAKDWADAQVKEVLRTLTSVTALIAIVFVLIFVASFAFGDKLLVLVFGQRIADYTYLLMPALFATACAAFVGFFLDVLIVFRNMKGALLANLLSAITSALVIAPAIGRFGMNGVNIAIIVSFGVGIALSIVFLLISFYQKVPPSERGKRVK